jgi:hypothetical protein
MAKVKWGAKFDYEFMENYKILQNAFLKNGIKRHIEVSLFYFSNCFTGRQTSEGSVPRQPGILLVDQKIFRFELQWTTIQWL